MLLLLIFVLGTTYLYYIYAKRQQRQKQLRDVIAKRLREREASIELAENSASLLNQEKRELIGAWNFQELRENLQNGTVTCLEVLRTYQWKAVLAHKKTNCVTLFVKEAERWATAWDVKSTNTGFKKPAFFGIPISLKECVPLEGYDTTRGFSQDVNKPSSDDSILVQQLKLLGFVPFVQTNVPQSLLSYSCSNPIYGTTCAPLDSSRTCGGSSGGEAALLAADGSLIGIGGDVGGSIRIPCHFTGMAGIKPSHLRFSHRGVPGAVPGRPLINANEGPMTKDIQTSAEFLKEIWSTRWITEHDPYVPPVLWNEDMYREGRKYRVGYYLDDDWFTPVPAIQRAVLEAKAHLETAGHTLVPFKPPCVPEMMRHYCRAVCVDGGKFISEKLFNDIIDPSLYGQLLIFFVPLWIQRLLSYPVGCISSRIANMMRAMTHNTSELRQTYAKIEEYRGKFVELMMENDLDALLCPPQVLITPPHDIPGKLFSGVSYTALFNLLDYGAGVVNVTCVNKKDEEKLLTDYPETDMWYRKAKEACKGSLGHPVNVQVAAPPYREEIVLRLLRDVEVAVTGK